MPNILKSNFLKKIKNNQDGSEAVTRMIMRLFVHWQLTYEQQAALLSLSANTHSTIARYKQGRATLSQDRIGHLLSIHKYLRQLFPLNKDLTYEWPTTPNQAFKGISPIDVAIAEGFLGLVKIRRYLENYMANSKHGGVKLLEKLENPAP